MHSVEEENINPVFRKIYGFFVALLLTAFVLQASYLALHVKIGVPPDELHHTYVSSFFKNAPFVTVEDTEKTHPYGAMSTHPYLYHLSMGKLSWINFFGVDDEIFIRFFSVLFSLATLIIGLQIMRELKLSPLTRILSLVIITNIPMFVFISASASYDTLINLLSALLLLYLVRYIQLKRVEDFLSVVLYLLVGSITKVTFLPFYLVFLVIFFVTFKSCFLPVLNKLKAGWSFRSKFLLVLAIIFFGMNVKLYVGNLVKYGHITPAAALIIGEEKAVTNFAQYRRDKELFRTAETRPLMGKVEFVKRYFGRVAQSILGILAHQNYLRSDNDIKWYRLSLVPALVGLVLMFWSLISSKIDREKLDSAFLAFISVGIFYFIVLLIDNYIAYKAVRFFGYSLQGRYLFPAMLPLVVLFVWVSLYPKNKIWRFLCAAWIALVFISQGFMDILPKLGPEWFT